MRSGQRLSVRTVEAYKGIRRHVLSRDKFAKVADETRSRKSTSEPHPAEGVVCDFTARRAWDSNPQALSGNGLQVL